MTEFCARQNVSNALVLLDLEYVSRMYKYSTYRYCTDNVNVETPRTANQKGLMARALVLGYYCVSLNSASRTHHRPVLCMYRVCTVALMLHSHKICSFMSHNPLPLSPSPIIPLHHHLLAFRVLPFSISFQSYYSNLDKVTHSLKTDFETEWCEDSINQIKLFLSSISVALSQS